jgi:hypothetical protein
MAMTANERKENNLNKLLLSVSAQIDREESDYPQKEIDQAHKTLIKNASNMYSSVEIENYLQDERDTRAEAKREQALNENPLLEKRQIRAEGGSLLLDDRESYAQSEEPTHTMPDGTEMAGATHGEYDEQMEGLMDKETPMLPDEEMEEDYVDYVMDETLSDEDKNYLISTLEQDDRLSMIFDQVVESATEFSGEGPVDGPGTEKSDSIPARLSDGEFVFTAKATEEIGVDTLMSMMKDAEAGAEQRQGVAYGGMVEDEGDPKATPIQTTGLLAAQGNIPNVAKPNRQVEEEMLKASPRRYYVPLSG